MFRAKLIAFIAFTMVFAQLQCVARCAGSWCSENVAKTQSVPPCHRHDNPSQDQTSAMCGYQVSNLPATLANLVQNRAQSLSAQSALPSLAGLVLGSAWANEPHRSAYSPPAYVPSPSNVLRI